MSSQSTPINIELEVLASTVRQEKEIKGIQMGKEEIKLPLFKLHDCLHRRSQGIHKTLIELVSLARLKHTINPHKPNQLLYTLH